MEQWNQQYKSRGYYPVVAWYGARGQQRYCAAYKRKFRFSFMTVGDPRATLARAFGMSGSSPINVMITLKDMKIVYKRGGYSSSTLQSEIRKHCP